MAETWLSTFTSLEALFDLRRPDSLRVPALHLLVVVKLTGVVLGDLLGYVRRQPRDPNCVGPVHGVGEGLGGPGVAVVLQCVLGAPGG